MWLVVRKGLKLALVGVCTGVMLAVPLARLLRRLLFEISPADPSTYVAIAAVLLTVAAAAACGPAWRAASVDPMQALRAE